MCILYSSSLDPSLVSEGSFEDLRLELPPEDLAGLVLGQRVHEHDAGLELLVRGHPLGHPVDDGLLEDVPEVRA